MFEDVSAETRTWVASLSTTTHAKEDFLGTCDYGDIEMTMANELGVGDQSPYLYDNAILE